MMPLRQIGLTGSRDRLAGEAMLVSMLTIIARVFRPGSTFAPYCPRAAFCHQGNRVVDGFLALGRQRRWAIRAQQRNRLPSFGDEDFFPSFRMREEFRKLVVRLQRANGLHSRLSTQTYEMAYLTLNFRIIKKMPRPWQNRLTLPLFRCAHGFPPCFRMNAQWTIDLGG